jgi:hypothetical protein
MDETTAVLRRLDLIEELDRRSAPPAELLAELRALVVEAEAWARREGDARARAAVEECRASLDPEPERLLNLALKEAW